MYVLIKIDPDMDTAGARYIIRSYLVHSDGVTSYTVDIDEATMYREIQEAVANSHENEIPVYFDRRE